GAGQAGAVTVVAFVGAVVVVSPVTRVVEVLDVVVVGASAGLSFESLAGRGRSMPTWDARSATGFWAAAGRAPAAAKPPNSTVRPAAPAATSLGSGDGTLLLTGAGDAAPPWLGSSTARMAATVVAIRR